MASEAVEREGKSYWGMGARECDSCKAAPALLFCRADSAFLCAACDTKVHGANKLASRHERVWMCEVCEQAPAAVTCKADAAALCVACDADIHSANPLARRHERVPVVPFFDSPKDTNAISKPPKSSPTSADALLRRKEDDRFADDDDKQDEQDEGQAAEDEPWMLPKENDLKPPIVEQYFFQDVDPYLDLDYAASMDQTFHQDSVVPVQPTRGVAVGFGIGVASVHHHHPPPPLVATVPDHPYYAPSLSRSVSSSEVGVVPDGGAMTDISNPYGGAGYQSSVATATAVMGMDREARVLRYREKRKNRRFEKTIRYASRKAYAETRPRIKGRFAKRTELEADGDVVVDSMYNSPTAAAGLMVDPGYGVVPSF